MRKSFQELGDGGLGLRVEGWILGVGIYCIFSWKNPNTSKRKFRIEMG